MDADQYLKGMSDCKNGVPHEDGKGEDYDTGFAHQYELEQLQSELTK